MPVSADASPGDERLRAFVDAQALAAAADALDLRLVVLFGSRARGGAGHPGSDLDVGVVAGAQRVSLMGVFQALAPAFIGEPLDVAILNDTDPLFRYEVFSRSELLYGDPDLYAEYCAFAYRAFVESADLRALEAALSRKKLDRLLHAAP